MAAAIKFNIDFYDVGILKYAAGQEYPATEETLHEVDIGHAEVIEIPDDQSISIPEVS